MRAMSGSAMIEEYDQRDEEVLQSQSDSLYLEMPTSRKFFLLRPRLLT